MNSLHISLTEFRNESRLLKEAASLVKAKVVDKVFVAALHADALAEDQVFLPQTIVRRFTLLTRRCGKTLFVQLFKYLEFCLRIYIYYKNKKIRYVNVHTVGLLPLGVALKYLYGAHLLYEAHELETETNGATGFRKHLLKRLERWLIKRADLTIVVSESIADWYVHEYAIPRPVVVLNAPKLRERSRKNYFREELGIRDDQLILLYQGGLVDGRGISLLLDAFKARLQKNIVVVFMGFGPLEEKIQKAALQYSNIFFYPAMAPDVVLEYTASADIGVSLIENTCLSYYYCLPNKLFEYAMVGLPVLVSNMKDMAKLVGDSDMGAIVFEFTSKGIGEAVDAFLSKDLSNMSVNAYRTACMYSWEVQEAKMLEAYAKMIVKNNREFNFK